MAAAKGLELVLTSTLLALTITGIPVGLLLAICELNLVKPVFMVTWSFFALFWTVYILMRFVNKHQ